MTTYIALLRKEPDSDYSVDFPDFPGCVTAGLTLAEAKAMAAEALAGHIEVMMEHGDPIPVPSSLEAVMADPDNADAVPFLLVSVVAPGDKAVRVNVTLPESLLRRIDAAARARQVSRSAFLARAAEGALAPGQDW
jgi:predicted RNase H-like HicB family nuclease